MHVAKGWPVHGGGPATNPRNQGLSNSVLLCMFPGAGPWSSEALGPQDTVPSRRRPLHVCC